MWYVQKRLRQTGFSTSFLRALQTTCTVRSLLGEGILHNSTVGAVQALARPAGGNDAQRVCRGEKTVKGNFQEERLSRVWLGEQRAESAHLVRGGEAPKKPLGVR